MVLKENGKNGPPEPQDCPAVRRQTTTPGSTGGSTFPGKGTGGGTNVAHGNPGVARPKEKVRVRLPQPPFQRTGDSDLPSAVAPRSVVRSTHQRRHWALTQDTGCSQDTAASPSQRFHTDNRRAASARASTSPSIQHRIIAGARSGSEEPTRVPGPSPCLTLLKSICYSRQIRIYTHS